MKTSFPTPSIDELTKHYGFLPPSVDLETVLMARWGSNEHAPNGTDELLAWLFILLNSLKKARIENAELHAQIEAIKKFDPLYEDWNDPSMDVYDEDTPSRMTP